MGKKFSIVFKTDEADQRLMKASISALESEVMVVRFGHTVEYDDSTETFTLKWWRKPEGGFDAN